MQNIRICKELDFLSGYWKEAKKIGEKTIKELPKMGKHLSKKGLNFIQYKDLDTWSVATNLQKMSGISTNLQALADKIHNMINLGRGNDVKNMVEKIASGRVKTLTRKIEGKDGDYLGKGSFRWNYKCYTLSETEIKRLKEYFNI